MSRGDSVICTVCGCLFGDSDCVSFHSAGPNDPWVPDYILADDPDQLAECGPNGFGVFLPAWMREPPAAHVYRSVPQTIAWSAEQILIFNEERYDTDSMHDESEDTDRFLINTPGIYLICLNITWRKLDATGGFAAYLKKNGAQILSFDSMPISSNADLFHSQCVTYEGPFEAGDFVQSSVLQTAIDPDDKKLSVAILSERYSPNFSATFLRLPA